jgi:hypothetical protein
MSRSKTRNGESKVRPSKGERALPGLSDELVAKLQKAVQDAQRKRLAQPPQATNPRADPAAPNEVEASESGEELEVYVTPGGRGRAAIVRRSDGQYCICLRWRVSGSWLDDDPNPDEGVRPEEGMHATIGDARNQVRKLRGFSDAILRYSSEDPGPPAAKR